MALPPNPPNPPTAAPSAHGSVEIAAAPEQIYALITDLDELAQLGEEIQKHRWLGGAKEAKVGAKFMGSNRNGFHRWQTFATITSATPGEKFAFDVSLGPLPVSRWEYRIQPAPMGSLVTESTWDRRPGWFATVAGVFTGVRDRAGQNQKDIEATLAKLKARAESN
jgi:hypothetical protein